MLDADGSSIGDSPERIRQIKRDLVEALADPDAYPSIIQRLVPRQLKHFSFAPEVTIFNAPERQHTILELSAPDRPGLLARIGQVLLEHRVRLTNAKIATLGERVEDVFFITDEQGEPLRDPGVCQALQQDLCKMLDEIQ